MSDAPKLLHHDSRGVQAYRWIMMGGVALISALSLRVLAQIDATAQKVETLQLQVGLFNSRIDAHVERLNTIDRRNDLQDVKIDDLQRLVWRRPADDPPTMPTPSPAPYRPPSQPPAAIVPSAPSLKVYP
jgi:hypothetical protein